MKKRIISVILSIILSVIWMDTYVTSGKQKQYQAFATEKDVTGVYTSDDLLGVWNGTYSGSNGEN